MAIHNPDNDKSIDELPEDTVFDGTEKIITSEGKFLPASLFVGPKGGTVPAAEVASDLIASNFEAEVASELIASNFAAEVAVELLGGSLISTMEAAWTDSVTVVNGRLVADKQAAYDRVDLVRTGVVESGDGASFSRDTGVIPPTVGGLELEFIYDGADEFYFGLSGNRCYISASSGKLTGGLGSDSIALIKGTTTLTSGVRYKARLTWDGTTVGLYLNDNLEYSGPQNGAPDSSLTLLIHALNIGNPTNHSNSSIISAAVLDAAGDPTNYWSASNMEKDRVGSSDAIASGGTPIVVGHPNGDHSMDRIGYTDDNGTIIPASLTDPTLDADGNPLQFGRNAHSLEIISGSSMSDYVLRYTQDGPLGQYLGGSGMEDGLQTSYAAITATDKVAKFGVQSLAVFTTDSTVPKLLEDLLNV